MVKYLRLFLFFFMLIQFGRSQESREILSITDEAFNAHFIDESNIPKLNGQFINIPQGYRDKLKLEAIIDLPWDQESVFPEIDEDGNFTVELTYSFPYQGIMLSIDKLLFIGLNVNEDFHITIDVEKLINRDAGSIHFYGKDAEFQLLSEQLLSIYKK